MTAKRFALAFGLAIILPAMIHSGVSIFSPPPRWEDYQVASMMESSPGDRQNMETQRRQRETERKAALKVFQTHLFAVAVPLGLAAMLAGAFCRGPAIGAGLMFGGIFSVCNGYYNCWSELSATLRFLSLLAAMVVLIYIGYRRLERRDPPPGI